jgi:peptidyl-prolyl cis-trans isomerase C
MRPLPCRMSRGAALAALLLTLGPAGCGPKMDVSTVATVNGTPVTIREVEERYARLERELETSPASPRADAVQLKRAILQELINRKLLLGVAGERKLSASADEIDQEEQKLLTSLSADEQKEVFSGGRMTPERFREILGEDLVLRKLSETLGAGAPATEAEIAEAYEKGKTQFFQQESVRARQILVNTEAETRAVKKRLALGEDFAKVAREASQSPDAKGGGDLGFFQRGQMPPELETWAFQLKPGQTSPVIETPYGFHILKVEEQKPPRQLELSEVRETIAGQIAARKREERYEELLSALRQKADIVYNRKHADLKPKKK